MKKEIIVILNNGFICTLKHGTICFMVRSQQYIFLEHTLMFCHFSEGKMLTPLELLQGWGLAHLL